LRRLKQAVREFTEIIPNLPEPEGTAFREFAGEDEVGLAGLDPIVREIIRGIGEASRSPKWMDNIAVARQEQAKATSDRHPMNQVSQNFFDARNAPTTKRQRLLKELLEFNPHQPPPT
jgi:hypothetical protein